MQLEFLDLLIVGLYAVVLIAIALYVSREKAGHKKDTKDYFFAGKSLPWWAIGASLIAANISAEQIIGMSGAGFAIGLAIASYEWMSAITLILLGKFIIPIFLKNNINTMPQFLEERFGPSVKYVMSLLWLVLYTVVNLTTVLWLGATAINTIIGVSMMQGMIGLGAIALLYSIYGGLKAVALTDIIQVVLLVFGGILITVISLNMISPDNGALAGFKTLMAEMPERFDMILSRDNPEYKNLPGIGVLLGGMWIQNIAYWGFNQYIIQRALGAKSTKEAQSGIVFAAFLKLLMPFIIVIPGMAAAYLVATGAVPQFDKPDQAYPTLLSLTPVGMRGLIFAALIAAILSSLASMMNSISTIFTMDILKPLVMKKASETKLVTVGRISSVSALVIALFLAAPLLGSSEQVFQNIQNWTGFFTPSIVAIFFLGMFWKRSTEIGALASIISSVVLSVFWPKLFPTMPFMDRIGVIFLISLAMGIVFSFVQKRYDDDKVVNLAGINFKTGTGFNLAAVVVTLILVTLYGYWW